MRSDLTFLSYIVYGYSFFPGHSLVFLYGCCQLPAAVVVRCMHRIAQ